jgi:hypothetical protein
LEFRYPEKRRRPPEQRKQASKRPEHPETRAHHSHRRRGQPAQTANPRKKRAHTRSNPRDMTSPKPEHKEGPANKTTKTAEPEKVFPPKIQLKRLKRAKE